MPGAHPCSEPICPEDPLGAIHAQSPSMPRASIPAQRQIIPTVHMGHPCQGPINAQGPSMPRAHTCPGTIHAKGPFLPRARPSRGAMEAHSYLGPIHAESLFISRANGGCPGSIPFQRASIPRAHGSLSIPRALHAEGPSLLGEHLSRGPMGAHLCLGSIHDKGSTLRRVHPSWRPIHA